MNILVVSRHFAFRGPLAAAFLKSFSSKLQVWGYALDGAEPWPEITKQMLWESFLEDLKIGMADPSHQGLQKWDAVLMLDNSTSTADQLFAGGQIFRLHTDQMQGSDKTMARALRDKIKNDTFVLLRDKLKIKPGS